MGSQCGGGGVGISDSQFQPALVEQLLCLRHRRSEKSDPIACHQAVLQAPVWVPGLVMLQAEGKLCEAWLLVLRVLGKARGGWHSWGDSPGRWGGVRVRAQGVGLMGERRKGQGWRVGRCQCPGLQRWERGLAEPA